MPGRHALGHLGREDDRAAVVEGADQVALFDASRRGVLGVEPHDPVVVAVDEHAVVFDLVQPAALWVAHGVEAEARVRGDHLQRVLAVQLGGVVALPGGDVLRAHGRPLGVDEAVGFEALEAARPRTRSCRWIVCRPLQTHGVRRVRTPVRRVLRRGLRRTSAWPAWTCDLWGRAPRSSPSSRTPPR